jgi:hypothetical protein
MIVVLFYEMPDIPSQHFPLLGASSCGALVRRAMPMLSTLIPPGIARPRGRSLLSPTQPASFSEVCRYARGIREGQRNDRRNGVTKWTSTRFEPRPITRLP